MEMTPDTTDFNSLSKKQLVELVIAKYNDCFRLEEENKKLREKLEKLTVRIYEKMPRNMRKEYQEFCGENNI